MSNDALIGKQLDEYRLETVLGQGGMARVYRAIDVGLDRWVAIKVIDASFRNDPDYKTRFEREAKAIAQLEHPHIVGLYRYGEVDGLLYMAMRYIEGMSLAALLKSYRQQEQLIPIAEAHRVFTQVCQALDYAHSRGVIHRDVKPANIMLDRQGNAFLADFGLALISDVGTRGEIFGTPHYIAPEQAMSSASAVPQSDLYAMGVILYEMFTGVVPFDASSALDVAMLHMTKPPTPPRQIQPDINPALEDAILKALEKKPSDRYRSGQELVQAFDQALKARSQVSLPVPPAEMSIMERVAVDLARRPLPPVSTERSPTPALERQATDPAASEPEPTSRPTTSAEPLPRSTRPVIYAGLGLGMLVVLGLFLLLGVLGAFFLLRSDESQAGSEAAEAGQAAAAETLAATEQAAPGAAGGEASVKESSAPVEAGAAPPANATAAEPPAAAEPASATNLQTYQILFAKHKGDSLFIVNQSDLAFPLTPLQVTDSRRLFNAEDVGVKTLFSGACISMWKEKGKPKAPDVSCDELGRTSVGNKARFWEESFEVYYGGELIGACRKNEAFCSMSIPVELASTGSKIDLQNDGGDD